MVGATSSKGYISSAKSLIHLLLLLLWCLWASVGPVCRCPVDRPGQRRCSSVFDPEAGLSVSGSTA